MSQKKSVFKLFRNLNIVPTRNTFSTIKQFLVCKKLKTHFFHGHPVYYVYVNLHQEFNVHCTYANVCKKVTGKKVSGKKTGDFG